MPHQLIAQLSRRTEPVLTCYDDKRQERIELTGKTLANWAAKAANCLSEEFACEAGQLVQVDLPLTHWRAAYWAIAVWACGGTIRTGGAPNSGEILAPAEVVIADIHRPESQVEADVECTLGAMEALARARNQENEQRPGFAIDEALDLPQYGDLFLGGPLRNPLTAAILTSGNGQIPASYAEIRSRALEYLEQHRRPDAQDNLSKRWLYAGTTGDLQLFASIWLQNGSIVLIHKQSGRDLKETARRENAEMLLTP